MMRWKTGVVWALIGSLSLLPLFDAAQAAPKKRQVRMYLDESSAAAGQTGPPIYQPGWVKDPIGYLNKLKQAGYNTAVVKVWGGGGIVGYKSAYSDADGTLPNEGTWTSNTTYADPLRTLTDAAGRMGMDVIAWVMVSKRSAGIFSSYVLDNGDDPWFVFDMHNAAWRTKIANIAIDLAKHYPIRGIFFDYIRTQYCNEATAYTPAANKAAILAFLDEVVPQIRALRGDRSKFVLAAFATYEIVTTCGSSFISEGRDPVTWLNTNRLDMTFGSAGNTASPYGIAASTWERVDAGAALLDHDNRQCMFSNNYNTGVSPTGNMPGSNHAAIVAETLARNPTCGGSYNWREFTQEQSDALRGTAASPGPFFEDAEPYWVID